MLEPDLSLDAEPLTGEELLLELVPMLDQEELPFPPVPLELVPAMRVLGGVRFGTRELDRPLADLAGWRDEALQTPGMADYLLFGVDGYGAVSRTLHYYLLHDPLALFLEYRWGGPYVVGRAGRMHTALGALPSLLGAAWAARTAGRLDEDERLVVVESDIAPSGWTRYRPGSGEEPAWQHIDDPLLAAREALEG